VQAADEILKKEDAIVAAALRFGPDSPEFNMLRHVWAQRVFHGTIEPSGRLAKISPDVQQLMFPGVTVDQAQKLAKDMDFLLGSKGLRDDAGGALAAASRVLNPWKHILAGGKDNLITQAAGTVSRVIPFRDAAGRYLLGKYYSLLADASSNPAVGRWILRGLEGDAAAREQVRAVVQHWANTGGALGSVIGQHINQMPRHAQ
jgi:hypothetical protein